MSEAPFEKHRMSEALQSGSPTIIPNNMNRESMREFILDSNNHTNEEVGVMKNKAVEAMVRVQFNIPEDTQVTVKCMARVDNMFEFEVEWMDDDNILYQCPVKLPLISYTEDTSFACS